MEDTENIEGHIREAFLGAGWSHNLRPPIPDVWKIELNIEEAVAGFYQKFTVVYPLLYGPRRAICFYVWTEHLSRDPKGYALGLLGACFSFLERFYND